MTPDERTELEAKADRARRRGELSQALALYSQIMAAYPHDGIVQTKLNILKESLEPSELNTAPANRPRAPLPKQDVLKGLLERIATRRRAP
jgi:hypothetical protein